MIRAFLALPLPPELANRLVPVQAALVLPRPVPVQDFHVTLVFLGDTREDVLDELHLMLEGQRLPAVPLALDGLGSYGGDRPQSVHARIRPDPALDRLQARLAQIVRSLGIALDRRRFQPHVTLGRGALPEPEALARGIARAGVVASAPVMARQLTLFRSRLRREGPLYDALADYPLTG